MERHTVLRVVSFLLKVLAWLSLVGGVLGLVLSVALGSSAGSLGDGRLGLAGGLGGAVFGLVLLVTGVLYFLVLFAYGDAIGVLLKILDNTQRILQREQEPNHGVGRPAY